MGLCSLELMNFWVVSVIIVIMPGKQGWFINEVDSKDVEEL